MDESGWKWMKMDEMDESVMMIVGRAEQGFHVF